jgi:rhamnosyltransferase
MVTVIIPVYNAEEYLEDLLNSLSKQSVEHDLIIIDSESTDQTSRILEKYNIDIVDIKSKDFNHGSTRNIGLKMAKTEVVVFLTQDVILKERDSLEKLVKPLIEDNTMAITYGRQLPHSDATIFGTFLRHYNYPNKSQIKNNALKDTFGLKTYFVSNSFAAYKKIILLGIGGFPENVILGEDAYVGAKIIQQGYSIMYVAESEVYHSHNYTLIEEFKRYFDIGVFHNIESWIVTDFPKADSEGFSFVKEEIRYLKQNNKFHLIFFQLLRTASKFLGYKLGLNQNIIPNFLKKKLSMHKNFWINND